MPIMNNFDARKESIVGHYHKTVSGITSTAVGGESQKAATVVYSVTVSNGAGAGTGRIQLVNASSTADTTPIAFEGTVDASGTLHAEFPHGLYLDKGLICTVSASGGTVTLTLEQDLY